MRGRTLNRAVWVPVLAIIGGIALGTAIVTVARLRTTSVEPSSTESVLPFPTSVGTPFSSGWTSGSPTPATTAEPTLALAPGWVVSEFPTATKGDQLWRIAALGDRIFVVGSHDAQGGIWHSVDGAAWQLASELPRINSVLGVQILGIARGDAGFAAVGANYSVDGATAVIWFSPDGDHWTDVTPAGDGCSELEAVTGASVGFVAVGSVCRYEADTGPQADGVSFTSANGTSWQQSPTSPALVDLGLSDVAWTGSELVSTGVYFGSWSKTLVSTDGLNWVPTPGGGMPTSSYVRRLIWADGRFTAVGQFNDSSGQAHATVWHSADATAWDKWTVGAANTQATAIAFDGKQWVLVGGLVVSESVSGSLVEWRSPDGLTWGEPRLIIPSEGNFLSDMIATDTGLLAVGGTPAPNGERTWVPVLLRYGS